LIEKPSVQRYLLDRLSKAMGYELTVSPIELTLWGGIGISAKNLKARSLTRPESFEAAEVRVFLRAGELVMGRMIPSKIFLLEPKIDMALRKGEGPSRMDTSTVLKDLLVERLSGYRSVILKKAQICIRNAPFELKDFHFYAQQGNGHAPRFKIRSKGLVFYKGESASFTLEGAMTQEESTRSNRDFHADLSIKTGPFPLTWIPWPSEFSANKGHARADITFQGLLSGPVSAEGKIVAQDMA
ncbi:MAG: hypothetical protein GY849_13655, partial [Deltaproteobacteria bacterium]|nr:hypothetical protein [Deltaproteobacteria bacterium]